jgi:hypothetical protein
MSEHLGDFLKEVANWDWAEFVKAEKDSSYTSNQAVVFGLIRSCAMQDLRAIKIAINRFDGKLKTPLKIEMPKIYYLYPNAEGSAPVDAGAVQITDDPHTVNEVKAIVAGELIPKREAPQPEIEIPDEEDLPSMTFRETFQNGRLSARIARANHRLFRSLWSSLYGATPTNPMKYPKLSP